MSVPSEEITIHVDLETARAYRAAPDAQRRKLDLLLRLRLQDALRPSASLTDLMRAVSHNAEERALTPEVLESLLNQP